MSYKEKIIEDIAYSIKECLKYIEAKWPSGVKPFMVGPYNVHSEQSLARLIYQLYNRDPKIAYYFNDIYGLEIKRGYEETVKNLHKEFKKKLVNALAIVNDNRDKFTFEIWGTWIQVMLKGDEGFVKHIKRRLYLNCNPEYIDIVIAGLVDLMVCGLGKTRPPKIIFKFPNYNKINENELIRADKLVIYYDNNPVTHEILRDWLGSIGKYLHEAVPLFTRKERNGAAFAYELPPEEQEYAKLHAGEEASFGSYMSLVIARYIYSWIVQEKKIPNSKEVIEIAYDIFEEKLKKQHKFFKWSK